MSPTIYKFLLLIPTNIIIVIILIFIIRQKIFKNMSHRKYKSEKQSWSWWYVHKRNNKWTTNKKNYNKSPQKWKNNSLKKWQNIQLYNLLNLSNLIIFYNYRYNEKIIFNYIKNKQTWYNKNRYNYQRL